MSDPVPVSFSRVGTGSESGFFCHPDLDLGPVLLGSIRINSNGSVTLVRIFPGRSVGVVREAAKKFLF